MQKNAYPDIHFNFICKNQQKLFKYGKCLKKVLIMHLWKKLMGCNIQTLMNVHNILLKEKQKSCLYKVC